MEKADVILLNWDGLKYSPACIDSLLSQTLLPHRIIIVDQASTDGSKELIRRYIEANLDKPIRMIELEENVGFSIGNNIAVKYALEFEDKPDFILYFNNDTKAFPDMLETMVTAFKEVEKCGIVGVPAYWYNTKKRIPGIGGWIRRDNLFSQVDGFPKFWTDGYVKKCLKCDVSMGLPLEIKRATDNFTLKCKKCGWDAYAEKYVSTDYIGGGCLMIKRQILEEVGMFDENFSPIYEEDVSMCCSVREKGYKVVHINTSGFYHAVSAFTRRDVAGFIKCHTKNKDYFIQKWGAKVDAGIV